MMKTGIESIPIPPEGAFATPGFSKQGADVPVELFEKIYLSPSSPKWFVDAVRAVLAKFGFGSVPVEPSGLLDAPPAWQPS
jgi:hypothetical protein